MSNHVNEEAPGNQLWHLEWLRVNPLSPRLQKDSRAGTGQGAVKEVGEQAAEQASEGGQCKLLTGNLLTLHWPRAESSLHLTKAHNALPWTRPSADPFTLLCMCVCCVCWCVCVGGPLRTLLGLICVAHCKSFLGSHSLRPSLNQTRWTRALTRD